MCGALQARPLNGYERVNSRKRGTTVERPKAIIWFERCYLGAFAIKLVSTIVNWRSANSAGAQIGTTIALLLWFGVMYRHSNASRWIIITFAIITTIWACISAAAGAYGWVMGIVLLVTVILNLTAALQLISASAEPWFQKRPADESGARPDADPAS